MNRCLKNAKTLAGLLFTFSLIVFGYFGKYDIINETDSRNTTLVSENEGEVMLTKKIAITFDDGPNPIYTPMLLDGLKERGIHATFFLLGESAQNYPDLVRRIQEEGHLIGNHTFHHKDLKNADTVLLHQEVVKTNEVIEKITGQTPQYIRPPFGSHKENLEEQTGMLVVLWNIDPLDWCCEDAAGIVRRIEENAKDNGIILMHDSYKSSVMAALTAIDDLQKEGYEFVTVDEIILE